MTINWGINLFSNDQETIAALNSLTTIARDQTRPLIIWVGPE